MSAKTNFHTVLLAAISSARPPDDSAVTKMIEAEIDDDAEHDHFHDHDHDHDEHSDETDDDHVTKDPYHDIEEHEDYVEEEIIPLGWYEHIKWPSIKSS